MMKEIKNPTMKKIKRSIKKRGYALWQGDDSPKAAKRIDKVLKMIDGSDNSCILSVSEMPHHPPHLVTGPRSANSGKGRFLLINI